MYTVVKIITQIICCSIILSCINKNQYIIITIKVIDKYTKEPRKGDRIDIRKGKWGIPMKRYVKVGQFYTDSLGKVQIELDKNEEYRFASFGLNNAFGSTEFSKGELKNNELVIIEVIPPERKNLPWLKNN